jgi:hypothetical protein
MDQKQFRKKEARDETVTNFDQASNFMACTTIQSSYISKQTLFFIHNQIFMQNGQEPIQREGSQVSLSQKCKQ